MKTTTIALATLALLICLPQPTSAWTSAQILDDESLGYIKKTETRPAPTYFRAEEGFALCDLFVGTTDYERRGLVRFRSDAVPVCRIPTVVKVEFYVPLRITSSATPSIGNGNWVLKLEVKACDPFDAAVDAEEMWDGWRLGAVHTFPTAPPEGGVWVDLGENGVQVLYEAIDNGIEPMDFAVLMRNASLVSGETYVASMRYESAKLRITYEMGSDLAPTEDAETSFGRIKTLFR